MIDKKDLRRVLMWIGLALLFNLGVLYFRGHQKALEFFTGYLIEYSLSVDNLFVFIMIFSFFGVNSSQQHKALQWGIAGAIVFRMIFVLFGVALIHLFHEIIYAFGALLIWSAWKMAFSQEKELDPDKIALVRWFRKIFPVTKEYIGDKFFTRTHAGIAATPLLIVVLVVESSDIMFAIDSIPAILAITQDPFIVITSNIFAIMGLRSLYFLLADVMGLFRFLKHGVALILAFVGLKMLIMDIYKLPTPISLAVIVMILAASIVASRVIKTKEKLSS
ncbi:MAG TPA: TerC/Alx family metal homeostasis membrane protein [bacterium]|jgi:tellurite resistance protein TerC